MKRIVALGSQEEVIGFGLAGCEIVVDPEDPEERIGQILTRKDVSLVILSRGLAEKLQEDVLKRVRESFEPVFFVLDESLSVRFKERIRQATGTERFEERKG